MNTKFQSGNMSGEGSKRFVATLVFEMWKLGFVWSLGFGIWNFPSLAADLAAVGSGSYTTRLPGGARGAPPVFRRGAGMTNAVPSNDWWSSLLWSSNTLRAFPSSTGGESREERIARGVSWDHHGEQIRNLRRDAWRHE